MSILSIGLVGAIRVFPVGLRASQRAELVSRAALLAERTVESLKLKPWEELKEGPSTSQEGQFETMLLIDRPKADGLTDPARLKRISVILNWQQEGRPRFLTVVTYVRRPASS